MADIFDQLGFKPDTDAFAALGFQEDAPPPPLTKPAAAFEMDRVLRGRPTNAPPAFKPPPLRQARPFYELDKPLPGTEITGLPPVQPTKQPSVNYDPLGARPDQGYQAAARAGLPTVPEQRPGPYDMPRVGDELARSGAQAIGSVYKGVGTGLKILGSGSTRGGGIGLQQAGEAIEGTAQAGLNLVPPPSPETAAMVGQKSWTEDPSQLYNPMYMARQVGSAGGSMVAFMGPQLAILKGISTAAGAARAAAALSVAESLANSAEVYDQAKAAGKTDAEAADLFRRNLLKDLPFTFITNKLGLYNERIGSRMARTAIGTPLEMFQEGGQGVISQHTLGEPLSKGLGENILGGALGGPIGAVMSPVIGEHAPQMAPVEPLSPVPPPALPRPEPTGMAPVEPLQAPVTQQQPVQPTLPPPPPAPDPRQVYAEAKALVASRPDAGTTMISKKFGVSQDEARGMLEQMVQEGLLGRKELRGGTTTYVNLEKQRQRAGKPVVQKAIQLPEVAPTPQALAEQAPVIEPPATLPADFGFVEDSRREVSQPEAPEAAEGVTPEIPSVHTPFAPTPIVKESLTVQPSPVEIQPEPQAGRLQDARSGSTESNDLRPIADTALSGADDNGYASGGVQADMIPLGNDLKVFEPIVRAIPVNVVNMLGGEQGAAQILLHDPAVLVDELSTTMAPYVVPDFDSLAGVVARERAKLSAATNLTGRSAELDSALRAFESKLRETAARTTFPETTSFTSLEKDALPQADPRAELTATSLDLRGHRGESIPAKATNYRDSHAETIPQEGMGHIVNSEQNSEQNSKKLEIPLGRQPQGVPTETKAAPVDTKPPITETAPVQETKLAKAKTAADARLRKKGIATGQTAPANIFTDPAVIRDMAISIAGSIQSGLITAKNYVQHIVQRFGQGASRVARQVFRRGQAVAKQSGQAGQAGQAASPATQQVSAVAPAAPMTELEQFQKESAAARVDQKASWSEKLKESWNNFRHSFTREFTHLPPGATYAPIRFELKRVEKSKSISSQRALQALEDQLDSLAPEELGQMMDYIALDDLQWRVKRQISEGTPVNDSDLPWKLTKVSLIKARQQARDVIKGNPKLVQAMRLRKQMWDDIRPALIDALKRAGYKDLTETLANPAYYRHRIIDRMDDASRLGASGDGSGKTFKLPVGRGYLKKSWINPHQYSLDYMRTEYEVMNQVMVDTARAEFIAYLRDPKNNYNIAPEVKKKAAEHNKVTVMPTFDAMAKRHNKQNPGGVTHTAESMYQAVMKSHPKDPGFRERLTRKIAGAQYMDFKSAYNEFFADTHGIYQPIEGEHFYMASSIPDQLAQEIMKIGSGEVLSKEIKKVMARGQRREELVIPRELIETLKDFMAPPKGLAAQLEKFVGKPINWWKQSKLIAPTGVVKYNVRNLSGDFWRVLTVLPRALKHTWRAFQDIMSFRKTGHPPNAEFSAWWRRGGMDSNLQTAEMGGIKHSKRLRRILVEPKGGVTEQAARLIGKAWDTYWGVGRAFTDVREGILRYATFLEFQDQIQKSHAGRPNTFAASLREEVMALRDRDDRAYKLSNDMMLAYDEVSAAGKFIRKYPIPFWSFQEQNLRTHTRLVRNAAIDGRSSAAVGYAALGGATATVHIGAATAMAVGKAAILMMGLKAAMTAMNWSFWDDEEDDIPESVKKDTHVILGRDADGKVIGFTRIGLIDDVLEWAGLSGAPYYAREYLNGRMTIQEWATETAKAPVNKIVSGLTPIFKIPAELMSGKAFFPDVFNARTIRDRGEYVARELGIAGVYKRIMGKPQPPVTLGSLLDLILYRWEPKQTHYNAFKYDIVPQWMAEHGHDDHGGYGGSRRADALYLVKEAVRYQDQGALLRGLSQYKSAGGTRKNLQETIGRMHPLGAIDSKKDRAAFEATLKPREKAQLQQAILFWKEHFDSKRGEVDRAAATEKLPLKKRRK